MASSIALDVYPPCKYGTGQQNRRRYSEDEKKIVKPFKTKYLEASSIAERRKVICNDILTHLFDYWIPRVPGGQGSIEVDGVSKVCIYINRAASM